MVNPLLLLPILNASSTMTTHRNGCFTQNPPGHLQYEPTTFVVCSQAINKMALGRFLDRPVEFGRSVKVGHTVPDEYSATGRYSSCVVKIDMEDGESDIMTWREIIVRASYLTDLCVGAPPHLGGDARIGPRDLLDLKIYGVSKVEAE